MPDLPGHDDALATIIDLVSPIDVVERVDLNAATGRVLVEDINADRDLPPFNRAMMDGYAVRSADIAPGCTHPVSAVVPAGASPLVNVPAGACVKIATGSAVPESLDAVVQHELSDRGDPVSFTIESIEPGHAIHPRGADARAGDVVLTGGMCIALQHLGIAATVGLTSLPVVRRPRVIVLTSGDEVRPVGEDVLPHQIRNSNGPMLCAAINRFGADTVRHQHVVDEAEPTIAGVRDAISEADFVITVGGVSVGERDHFPTAYKACGVEMAITGARIQPGKPIHAGQAPDGTVVIGLPGNPVSALVCAHLFIWPAVRAAVGLKGALPWREVELAKPVRPNPKRQAFRPAWIQPDGTVIVPNWAGSGDLVHTARTDGILALPIQSEPVPAGSRLPFLPWA